MKRQLTDARLIKPEDGLDGAIAVGREHQHAICMREGGEPGNVDVWPLIGGGYRVVIHWSAPGNAGGRAGRKRARRMSAEISPPRSAADE